MLLVFKKATTTFVENKTKFKTQHSISLMFLNANQNVGGD